MQSPSVYRKRYLHQGNTMKSSKLLPALLCSIILSLVLTFGVSAAYDDTPLPGAKLNTVPIAAGDKIEEPSLNPSDADFFNIVSYQWYKDEYNENCRVSVGDIYLEGTYYLDITIRLRSVSGFCITDTSYLGGNDYQEISCSVDPDAGSIHSVFSINIRQKAGASILLPSVTAGTSIGKSLQNAYIAIDNHTPATTMYLVYEDDALLAFGGSTKSGFFLFSDNSLTFKEGRSYEIIGLAASEQLYVEEKSLSVLNPDVADNITLAANETGAGFTADYFCKQIPTISTVSIIGVTPPVDGDLPDLNNNHLLSAEPKLYRAEYSAWSCGQTPFEGGQNYRVDVLITSQPGIRNLTADTPVTINGIPAKLTSSTDEGLIFSIEYHCEKTLIKEISVTGVIEPADGAQPSFDNTQLVCAEPDLYSAEYLSWNISTGSFVGGECYELYLLLIPKPNARGLCAETPVFINGFPSQFIKEQDGSFIFQTTFTAPKPESPPIEPLPFQDISESDWYHESVAFCFHKGLMNGTSETIFSPAKQCTRAMVVSILYRLSGSPSVSYDDTFTDVPSHTWYTDSIMWATQNHIVNGYGNGKFGPNNSITREQFATILLRYAESCGKSVADRSDLSAFFDATSISNWALDAMRWSVARGLINGKIVGNAVSIQPRGLLTRAECATILMRYCLSFQD